jgi:hypothetical protein
MTGRFEESRFFTNKRRFARLGSFGRQKWWQSTPAEGTVDQGYHCGLQTAWRGCVSQAVGNVRK